MLKQPKVGGFKSHKGRCRYKFSSFPVLSFGQFGLVSLEPSRLTAAQLSAIEFTLRRSLKRSLRSQPWKIILRVFPHTPVSKKPLEVRMGKGKGGVSHWISRVRKGSVLLEVSCSGPISGSNFLIRSALSSLSSKLPFQTRVVTHFGISSGRGFARCA